jgi:ABC-type Fe3+ transport system permease subunit
MFRAISIFLLAAAAVLLAILLAASSPVIALVAELTAGGAPEAGSSPGLDVVRAGLVLTSLEVAGIATALSLVWGLASAWVAAAGGGRLGAAVETLSLVPLLLPSIVTALGWLHFLGPGSWLASVVWPASSESAARAPQLSPVGAGFVLSLVYFPCVTLLCVRGLRDLDPDVWRAAAFAAGHGARRVRSPGRSCGRTSSRARSLSSYSRSPTTASPRL